MTTQLDFPEPRQRKDWSAQSERIWAVLMANPGKDIPAPALNRAAAGEDGRYISSFSKRISECRRRAQANGGDVILSRDEWGGGRRFTHYRFILDTRQPPGAKVDIKPSAETGQSETGYPLNDCAKTSLAVGPVGAETVRVQNSLFP